MIHQTCLCRTIWWDENFRFPSFFTFDWILLGRHFEFQCGHSSPSWLDTVFFAVIATTKASLLLSWDDAAHILCINRGPCKLVSWLRMLNTHARVQTGSRSRCRWLVTRLSVFDCGRRQFWSKLRAAHFNRSWDVENWKRFFHLSDGFPFCGFIFILLFRSEFFHQFSTRNRKKYFFRPTFQETKVWFHLSFICHDFHFWPLLRVPWMPLPIR